MPASVEEKLKAYRKKKEEDRISARRKDALTYLFSLQWLKELLTASPSPETITEDYNSDTNLNSEDKDTSHEADIDHSENNGDSVKDEGYMSWYFFIIKLLLWLVLQAIFVELEFGAVFFIISGFYLMFTNMGRRRQGEASAYSVFNPNCESIDGTLTAQQFENEIRHRNVQH
eukprot:TRINITY_DN12094_c0_g1_i9.p1 TRINITY_DN12094_c0_g1~~TRINITY_DN12094_c0_g1_i9.p1  ORF type:complete len:173 (-),score=28.26 TRINITY_DN12094_c0_g1_i9:136-654(-)